MNYTELVTAVKAYADRYDNEVSDNMDTFFRMAEARINRSIKTRGMSARAQMILFDGHPYYPLPADFAGIRDIEIVPNSGTRKTLTYFNPEQANMVTAATDTNFAGYTIIANQLQLIPAQANGVVEIVYYQMLPPLSDAQLTNWMSDDYPDAYLAALMLEIESFVKNDERAILWDTRLQKILDDIDSNDQRERWSGTPMQTRVM